MTSPPVQRSLVLQPISDPAVVVHSFFRTADWERAVGPDETRCGGISDPGSTRRVKPGVQTPGFPFLGGVAAYPGLYDHVFVVLEPTE